MGKLGNEKLVELFVQALCRTNMGVYRLSLRSRFGTFIDCVVKILLDVRVLRFRSVHINDPRRQNVVYRCLECSVSVLTD